MTGLRRKLESKESTLSIECEQNGAKHDVKISEIIRLMTQTLEDLGLTRTSVMLQEESSVPLEPRSVLDFRHAILTGDWEDAECLLPFMHPENLQDLQLMLRRQKFVELMEGFHNEKALVVLQNEVTPLETDQTRLHQMASLLFCSSKDEIKEKMVWSGSEIHSRQELLEHITQYIHPTFRLPPQRLPHLLAQAYEWQRLQCVYHSGGSMNEVSSIFVDHLCTHQDRFPSRTLHILRGHTDEVWYVAFSNSGKYLASVSKDNACIVWSLENYTIKEKLSAPSGSTYCAWSPDDSKLLTCGCDHTLRLWSIGTDERPRTFMGHTDQVTCCAWLPDAHHFFSGACDKKLFCWNINGEAVSVRQGNRPVDLKINADGTRVVTASFDRHIIIYSVYVHQNKPRLLELCKIPEYQVITSLSLNSNGRFAIVNVQALQEIHLWDLDQQRLMKRYKGHKQDAYIIRSCFGGRDDTFIISGSEDNRIYIWHREKQTVLTTLDDHSKTVNCVAWCPTDSPIFASASDDTTVRIWGPAVNVQNPRE